MVDGVGSRDGDAGLRWHCWRPAGGGQPVDGVEAEVTTTMGKAAVHGSRCRKRDAIGALRTRYRREGRRHLGTAIDEGRMKNSRRLIILLLPSGGRR